MRRRSYCLNYIHGSLTTLDVSACFSLMLYLSHPDSLYTWGQIYLMLTLVEVRGRGGREQERERGEGTRERGGGETPYVILHISLSSDVVECMANSDNVVRAGLTPKYRDKTTLCDMLHYTPRSPLEQLFKPKPHPQSPDIVLYDPPTPEFIIARIEMKNETVIPVVTGPSIILIVEGSGVVSVRGSSDIPEGSSNEVTFRPGEVLFIPAMNIITATPTNTTLIFQAYCEI